MDSIYSSYTQSMMAIGIGPEDYAKRYVFWAVLIGGTSYFLRPSQMFYGSTGQMRPWAGWTIIDGKPYDVNSVYVTWPIFTVGLSAIMASL